MIISKTYAKKLVRAGKATEETVVNDANGQYMAITRHDIQRTDHYAI